jgi:hypothetical protein
MEPTRNIGHFKFNVDTKDSAVLNFFKIFQLSEQLGLCAQQAAGSPLVTLDEMERLCQVGDFLQKELMNVRNELIRRKNYELLLPSPNTQKHLPCSTLLSPDALNTSSCSAPAVQLPVQTPDISPQMTPAVQNDEPWRSRKADQRAARRSPQPLYVNLTEQMILAQSSRRKRPFEGDLYCHNCKTKDTPEWRRGPMGAKTLCNACGIRWRLSQSDFKKKEKDDKLQLPQTPQQISQILDCNDNDNANLATQIPQQNVPHQQPPQYEHNDGINSIDTEMKNFNPDIQNSTFGVGTHTYI